MVAIIPQKEFTWSSIGKTWSHTEQQCPVPCFLLARASSCISARRVTNTLKCCRTISSSLTPDWLIYLWHRRLHWEVVANMSGNNQISANGYWCTFVRVSLDCISLGTALYCRALSLEMGVGWVGVAFEISVSFDGDFSERRTTQYCSSMLLKLQTTETPKPLKSPNPDLKPMSLEASCCHLGMQHLTMLV